MANPNLRLPRWHGFITRDDLQDALRFRAEDYLALEADECIAITLNPEEYLWPDEEAGQFDDSEMTNHHMYFRVMTEAQWEALKVRADARLDDKWWGYQKGRRAEEIQGLLALKTKRPNIRSAHKIKVETWIVTGELRRRTRYMVDPVSYQRRTQNALPMPRIVILQWMMYPGLSKQERAKKLALKPPAPTPRGMDDRGPLPPHVPPPGPQGEGEHEGQGGNNDQEEPHDMDGSLGTEDMLFLKGKLETLVIDHHKLEQQVAAISSRYVSCDDLLERAPEVLSELCSLKGNLELIEKNHELLKEKMVTISTGVMSLEELTEKAPLVVNEVFTLKANLEFLAMKHEMLNNQMVTISTGILSLEEIIEKAPQVTNMVFSLKSELESVAMKQENLQDKMDSISSYFLSSEEKLALLVEKTDTLEEQMAYLSCSSLSLKENYKLLCKENDILKGELLSLKTKAVSSMRNANPIGFPMKKNLSIIGMRKAKGKNKEVGLTLDKLKTDLKKEIIGVKKMLSSLQKENVVFTPVEQL